MRGLVGAEGVLSVVQASCRCVLLTYDTWGRVLEQRGCCGSENRIEVQVVTAEYDGAGRKRFEKELRSDGSVVRTIAYRYDLLGRLQSIGDYRGTVVYAMTTPPGDCSRRATQTAVMWRTLTMVRTIRRRWALCGKWNTSVRRMRAC